MYISIIFKGRTPGFGVYIIQLKFAMPWHMSFKGLRGTCIIKTKIRESHPQYHNFFRKKFRSLPRKAPFSNLLLWEQKNSVKTFLKRKKHLTEKARIEFRNPKVIFANNTIFVFSTIFFIPFILRQYFNS